MRHFVLMLALVAAGCTSSGDDGDDAAPTPTPWACFGYTFLGDVDAGSCALTTDCSVDGTTSEVRVACIADSSAHDCTCSLDGAQVGDLFTSAGGPAVCPPAASGYEPLVDLANEACGFLLPEVL